MSNFNLKSGNATPFKQMGSSPAKQSIGGDAGEAVDHWKKYKSAKKAAKGVKKGVDKVQMGRNYNPDKGKLGYEVKKIVSKVKGKAQEIARRVTKPSHGDSYAKMAQGKYGKKLVAARKLITKVTKKGVGKLAGAALGPAATVAGLAYGAYKSGQKHSGGKAGSKEGQAKWKTAKKKAGKSDIWGKNK